MSRPLGPTRTADELASAQALNAKLAEQLHGALSALERTERELRELRERVETATPRSGIRLPGGRHGSSSVCRDAVRRRTG